jgi:hypothetical protein
MNVGDNIEVMVMTQLDGQVEWVPAVVSFIGDIGYSYISVVFEGGSRQRFDPGTDRLRLATARKEGEEWAS